MWGEGADIFWYSFSYSKLRPNIHTSQLMKNRRRSTRIVPGDEKLCSLLINTYLNGLWTIGLLSSMG